MFFDLNNSFNELETLRREIDNIFNRSSVTKSSSFPLVNIYDNSDEIKVVAELPGINKEDLDITLTNGTLTLSGKREAKRYGEKVLTLRQERSSGEFEKRLRMPVAVNSENISANFSDGILTINLPKAEEAKPKKIMIQA